MKKDIVPRYNSVGRTPSIYCETNELCDPSIANRDFASEFFISVNHKELEVYEFCAKLLLFS